MGFEISGRGGTVHTEVALFEPVNDGVENDSCGRRGLQRKRIATISGTAESAGDGADEIEEEQRHREDPEQRLALSQHEPEVRARDERGLPEPFTHSRSSGGAGATPRTRRRPEYRCR